MTEKYYLTCDIGTSVTKTVLYTENFRAVASSSEENIARNPKACWLEEEPEQWWESIKKEIKAVIEGIDPENIIGAATCGQMHAPILVDREGNALFSCLSWPDARTIGVVEEVREAGFSQPYFTSTAPKILWIKRNHPEILEKTYKVLIPKDFIRMKLSGTFYTDNVDAGGTAMYDSENKTWNWDLVDYIGLDHDKLPDVYPSGEIVGKVSEKAAKETNLVPGIPMIAGTGDFGIGRRIESTVLRPGNILLYLGTGPGVWWVSEDELFSRRSRNSLCILGVAGTMPQWFKNSFFDESLKERAGEMNVFDYLDSEAAKIDAGSDGLVIMPHLMGERSYGGRTYSEDGKMNPYARGVFFGLCMGHTRYHIFRAIREGITYHLKLCWEHIKKANPGSSSDLIITSGGGAKSKLWRQIISDVFNLPVGRLTELETSTLGLACLTSVAVGKHKSFEEAASIVKNPIIDITQPNPDNHARYIEMFNLYERLETSLEPFFQPKK